MMTPTAPMTAMISVFKFSSGCVTAEVPVPAAKTSSAHKHYSHKLPQIMPERISLKVNESVLHAFLLHLIIVCRNNLFFSHVVYLLFDKKNKPAGIIHNRLLKVTLYDQAIPVVMIKSGFPRCGVLQPPPFKAQKKHLNLYWLKCLY